MATASDFAFIIGDDIGAISHVQRSVGANSATWFTQVVRIDKGVLRHGENRVHFFLATANAVVGGPDIQVPRLVHDGSGCPMIECLVRLRRCARENLVVDDPRLFESRILLQLNRDLQRFLDGQLSRFPRFRVGLLLEQVLHMVAKHGRHFPSDRRAGVSRTDTRSSRSMRSNERP